VSLATLRKILGLEDIRDESGKLVQEAPLEAWANVKQRALDHALQEINKHSDIELEVEFTGRGSYRKVNSLGFRITAKKIPDVRKRLDHGRGESVAGNRL
jgi:plasmid replication initiation protein